MQPAKIIGLSVFLIAALAFKGSDRKRHLYLVGDSTMSVKEIKAYPETGWGMPFAYFFDSSIIIDNRAKNGRSTRTFLSENLWQPIVSSLQPGDYVFIQFGHNDEVKEKTDRYTTPEEFKANLLRYVNDTKSKGGIPILLTPVSRRKFDKAGQALETHDIYTGIVKDVAVSTGVSIIDLDAESIKLYQQMGEQNSKLLFNQLQPGDHPNYPLGKIDNTHFNELGARLIAQLVLKQLMTMHTGLENYVVKRHAVTEAKNGEHK